MATGANALLSEMKGMLKLDKFFYPDVVFVATCVVHVPEFIRFDYLVTQKLDQFEC